ncbi:MAG TPA: amino acid permease [Thermoprotei archaeon]|nr:amino acid permease [Thermoprotei archaeon]
MSSEERVALRREIGLLGSFSMGFADVGADVFLAIGIVTAYAAGYAPAAFAIASICYISTGLVYSELSALYPYAGGGQVYGMRGSNDIMGFLVGWAILLDYVLDIGLFSIASAGYLSFIFPRMHSEVSFNILGYVFKTSFIGLTAFIIVLTLIILNIIGIKESSLFNIILVLITVTTELIILILGFVFSFSVDKFISQLLYFGNPARLSNVFYTGLADVRTENFIYGVTLAMSSFIGIESIAQAAEETRNPWKYLPRAFKLSIVSIIIFTLAFSVLGLGVLGWEGLTESVYSPIAAIASKIPVIGGYFSIGVAIVAFLINLVSTNTGVIGVSRVVYSMSRFRLVPRIFSRLHRKRATPYIAIIIFGLIGGLLAFTGELHFVAGLYNFGALLSYFLVNYSHIKLRVVDRDAYRPWKTPLNVSLHGYEVSIVSIIGLISTGTLFSLVVLYHPAGRVLGTLWVLAGLLIFIGYRLYSGLGIMKKVSLELLPPAVPYIHTAVLVTEDIPVDKVVSAIKYNLPDIHRLIIIDHIRTGVLSGDLDIYDVHRESMGRLREVCSRLRDEGYLCDSYVVIGDDEVLLRRLNELRVDQVAIITPKRPTRKGKRIYYQRFYPNIDIIHLYIPVGGL